ncbi:unnamed protein product [Calypogeia fissa]
MGNFCSVPMPWHHDDHDSEVRARGGGDLVKQVGYDIHKVEGVVDSRDDYEESNQLSRISSFGRRPSKRYYEVSKSAINRIHPQLSSSAMSSFRLSSAAAAGMVSFSNWNRTTGPSSTDMAMQTSSPSSGASTLSSDSDKFVESNGSDDQFPSIDLARDLTPEHGFEESARVEESH